MLIPKGKKPRRIKSKRTSDKKHLEYVASLPCACCGRMPVEIHHLLRADPARGMGRKAGDEWVIPLCPAHHRNLHMNGNEVAFLKRFGVYGPEIAEKLWRTSCENKKS